ncbi:protein lcl2 [Aspergillus glaucus CBS 516.65]|uniref:Long chronological lifespan protein 2 n=1 Tax=Aspergillus glaucus CBS 516.65 TaxID=1160497 RepID=A0A1L9V6U0_ASPGL|nr:hypothetical protein ASPGLDRAFT_158695 [Aspergillus glaucus CBS 516.65]OJJ79638.1 hypothetical protein ASPGLDRAFT_158695 [Aspergillus glaucus CBS 516.65]
MLPNLVKALWAFLLLASVAQAQFQFFEHMFGGGGGGGQRQGRQQAEPHDGPSDPTWYQNEWESARCSKYLCPDTLACVHFPHHCPCPHPDVEEKIELGEGSAVCVSKGGYKAGEAARKIELARKGLL